MASAGLAPPQYPDVEEDEEDVDGDEGDEDARSGRVRTIHRPHGRFIPGWGFFGGQEWQGRVLIDTLMNLPLLLWAATQTGEHRYREVALAHADTTVRYHLRPDGSTYHVYRFEPDSGAPMGGDTYQGRAPESYWSRGQ